MKIYLYSHTGQHPNAVSPPLRDMGGGFLVLLNGATCDGSSLWVVDKWTNKAYEFTLASLFGPPSPIAAVDYFTLHSNNRNATGM